MVWILSRHTPHIQFLYPPQVLEIQISSLFSEPFVGLLSLMIHGRTGAVIEQKKGPKVPLGSLLSYNEPHSFAALLIFPRTHYTEPHRLTGRMTPGLPQLVAVWTLARSCPTPKGIADRARDQHKHRCVYSLVLLRGVKFCQLWSSKISLTCTNKFSPRVFCKRVEVTFNSKGFPICTFSTPPLTHFGPSLELHWSFYCLVQCRAIYFYLKSDCGFVSNAISKLIK